MSEVVAREFRSGDGGWHVKTREGRVYEPMGRYEAVAEVAKAEVQRPGSRGGKGYWDDHGHWQYGERPDVKLPAIPDASIADLEAGNEAGHAAVEAAAKHVVQERIERTPRAGLTWEAVSKAWKVVWEHVREKFDLKKTARELAELGRKHGPAFLAYAIAVEVTEDVVLPIICTHFGHPEAVPILLAWHSEWFMYPLYFAIRKRMGGKPMPQEEFAKAVQAWARAHAGRVPILFMSPAAMAEAIAKAEQLGFNFGPRQEVQAPGSRGGKFYRRKSGKVAYGERPSGGGTGGRNLVAIDRLAEAASNHAKTCRRCSHPIIDEEGNPGLFGEACPDGLQHLIRYSDAIGYPVPRPWREQAGGAQQRPLRVGDIVQYSKPGPGEENELFVLREHNGDRVLIESMDSRWEIKPIETVAVGEVRLAKPGAGASSASQPQERQPWEMTRDEWHDEHLDDVIDRTRAAHRPEGQKPKHPDDVHRESVQAALREGKRVRPEVLEDYPDLQRGEKG